MPGSVAGRAGEPAGNRCAEHPHRVDAVGGPGRVRGRQRDDHVAQRVQGAGAVHRCAVVGEGAGVWPERQRGHQMAVDGPRDHGRCARAQCDEPGRAHLEPDLPGGTAGGDAVRAVRAERLGKPDLERVGGPRAKHSRMGGSQLTPWRNVARRRSSRVRSGPTHGPPTRPRSRVIRHSSLSIGSTCLRGGRRSTGLGPRPTCPSTPRGCDPVRQERGAQPSPALHCAHPMANSGVRRTNGASRSR